MAVEHRGRRQHSSAVPAHSKQRGKGIDEYPHRLKQIVDSTDHGCYGRRLARFAKASAPAKLGSPTAAMKSRCSILGGLLALATVAIGTSVHAAPPSRINHLVDKPQLSEPDRADIRLYAEFWSDRLAGAEGPAVVDEARAKLVDPLRAVRVGDVFRLEYSRSVVPLLGEAARDATPHATINALQVVALLGTPAALEIILSHASVQDEEDFSIRLWAARTFPVAIRQNVLPANDIDRALRQLGDAARREPQWLVLRRQFEAIASIDSPLSRDLQVKVLKAAMEAMKGQEGPSDIMEATYRALFLIRNEYLALPPADKETVGKLLAPVLCDLCTVAAAHWDSAQEDDAARTSYGGAVLVSENLLKLIDARVRPQQSGPRTELGPAWRDRQKGRFDSDHAEWRSLLQRPPYNKSR